MSAAASLRRVAVIGISGTGKTTFARALAGRLGCPHIELDVLHWAPDWAERPDEDFRADVSRAVAADRWVCDGNYSAARDLIWPCADTIVWLDYGFALTFGRALRRTCRRVFRREPTWHGNVETFRHAFLDRYGIPWWVVRTWGKYRREYRELCESGAYPGVRWVVFRRPGEAERFLKAFSDFASPFHLR